MKKLLHHIRRQSEETRKKILHFLTVFFAVVLVFLWIFSLGSNLSSEETQVKIKETAQPFSALKDNIPDVW